MVVKMDRPCIGFVFFRTNHNNSEQYREHRHYQPGTKNSSPGKGITRLSPHAGYQGYQALYLTREQPKTEDLQQL